MVKIDSYFFATVNLNHSYDLNPFHFQLRWDVQGYRMCNNNYYKHSYQNVNYVLYCIVLYCVCKIYKHF